MLCHDLVIFKFSNGHEIYIELVWGQNIDALYANSRETKQPSRKLAHPQPLVRITVSRATGFLISDAALEITLNLSLLQSVQCAKITILILDPRPDAFSRGQSVSLYHILAINRG